MNRERSTSAPPSPARRGRWLALALLAAGLLLLLATLQSPAAPAPQTEPPAELETFVPSEKLSADSAVAFPVDI